MLKIGFFGFFKPIFLRQTNVKKFGMMFIKNFCRKILKLKVKRF